MAQALDLGVTAWAPLAAGLLSGKYNRPAHQGDEPRRLDTGYPAERDARTLAIVDVVMSIAQSLGATPAQVALAWLRQQGVIPIIGDRTLN